MAGRARTGGPASPFLKWAGGKTQLLEQYERFLPASLEGITWVEPFVGSGALFFHVLATRHPRRCILRDSNPDLVNLYVQIRDRLDDLLPPLTDLKARHNAPGISQEDREGLYYQIRASKPEPGTPDAAARFLYLNKTCFNGLHRLNSRGEFNVPMGSYKSPAIFDPAHLAAVSQALQGVQIQAGDFRDTESLVEQDSFLYVDPPYAPLSDTSHFTAYDRNLFGAQDQRALRDMLVRLSPRCRWMLSNSTAPLILDLYGEPGMHLNRVLARRHINSDVTARGAIEEVVVTNYPVRS